MFVQLFAGLHDTDFCITWNDMTYSGTMRLLLFIKVKEVQNFCSCDEELWKGGWGIVETGRRYNSVRERRVVV